MAESTLSLTYNDVASRVGYFIGYTATVANWTVAQAAHVDRIMLDGYRSFLRAYPWSFLRPLTTLTLWPDVALSTAKVTGVYTSLTTFTATVASFYPSMVGRTIVVTDVGSYTIFGYTSSTIVTVVGDHNCIGKTFSVASEHLFRLPDYFGGMLSPLTFAQNVGWPGITIKDEAPIRQMWQVGPLTGPPMVAAVIPVAYTASGTIGQRYNLYVYPDPEQVYVMSYRMRVQPDTWSGANFPYGGSLHAETIRAFCMAEAEKNLYNAPGVYAQGLALAFQQSLEIEAQQGPENLGVSRDTTEDGPRFRDNHRNDVTVTYSP